MQTSKNQRAFAEQAVRDRGEKAARDGQPESSCPYPTNRGGYRDLWLEGFRSARSPSVATA